MTTPVFEGPRETLASWEEGLGDHKEPFKLSQGPLFFEHWLPANIWNLATPPTAPLLKPSQISQYEKPSPLTPCPPSVLTQPLTIQQLPALTFSLISQLEAC